MNSTEISQRFIEFYEGKGYQLLPRAPMLDPSIPMSFVMSAGLVQIENSLSRDKFGMSGGKYALVQDCFRHFDLEKVGKDDIHLSFFTMPGAFVFGSIDPLEVVRNMWNLVTDALEVNPQNLWASYFGGDFILGHYVPEDVPVRNAWLDVGLPPERVIALDKNHNFWIQGDGFQIKNTTRRCGPNTELFYDRGIEYSCNSNCNLGCPCGRFVEFSNSLFIRCEINKNDNSLISSAVPFIETVIGIERTAMILEQSQSIFGTSAYQVIFREIEKYIPGNRNERLTSSEQIIADHVKALYRLVEDGAPPPGKDGRQRIIKILIRKIITQEIVLNIQSPNFMKALTDCVASLLSSETNVDAVKEKMLSYYFLEKDRYIKTLERGYKQITRLANHAASANLSEKQIRELRRFWGIPEIITRTFLLSRQQKSSDIFTPVPEGINQ